jgi:hypothetical protein
VKDRIFTPAEGFATGFVFGLLLCLTIGNTGCGKGKADRRQPNVHHSYVLVSAARVLGVEPTCYPNESGGGCSESGYDGFTCVPKLGGGTGVAFCTPKGECVGSKAELP